METAFKHKPREIERVIIMSSDSDIAVAFKAKREDDKKRRERNLENADLTGFTKHTEYHYSRDLCGSRLDYWPSRNKFQYKGRVMCGDIQGFIRNKVRQTKRG
jgi:hypothetical protein